MKTLFLSCSRRCSLANPIPIFTPSSLPAPNTWAIKAKFSLSLTPEGSHIIQLCRMKSKIALGEATAYVIKDAGGAAFPGPFPVPLPLPAIQASVLQSWENVRPHEFKRHQPYHCQTTEPASAPLCLLCFGDCSH